MSRSTHSRWVIGAALIAVLGVLGLAGCARVGAGGTGGTGPEAGLTGLSWDGQALEAIGFRTQDLAVGDPVPAATMNPDRGDGHRLAKFQRLRFGFGRRLLHGEAVVRTEEGTRTVVVQRGTVTAIDATSVTVKSADGFALTWIFDNPIHVLEHRTSVQPADVAVGTQVGVAGYRQGETVRARLIVIPGALQ